MKLEAAGLRTWWLGGIALWALAIWIATLFGVGGRIAQLLAAVASAADDAAGSVRDHAADRHLAVLRRLARKVKGEGHIFFIRHGEASV